MIKFPISIRPFGAYALIVEWPNRVDENILDAISAFIKLLKNTILDEKEWEFVPAYNTLTLIQISKPISFNELSQKLHENYTTMVAPKILEKSLWRLPVCYDLDFGIDIKEVSVYFKKSIPEIIDLHTSNIYTVYSIGFLPGFMYLGGVPKALEMPRKATPRLKVPKGAVGLASKQTGIYPQESPGGWNIIGNCPVAMFSPKNNPPCFVNLGDKIQFYAISRAAYDLLKIEEEVGIYKPEKLNANA